MSALPRLLKTAIVVCLAGAVLLPLLAFGVDGIYGSRVLLVAPHDPAMVAANRALWVAGEPVAELYGSPMSNPVRVLVFDRSALLHPAEDPTLALLLVGDGGPRPTQVRTLWWATGVAVVAALGLGLAAAAGLLLSGRKALPADSPRRGSVASAETKSPPTLTPRGPQRID